MAIKIIDEEPDIHLTRDEYNKLYHEWQQSMMFYAGPVITFESWVRRKKSKKGWSK